MKYLHLACLGMKEFMSLEATLEMYLCANIKGVLFIKSISSHLHSSFVILSVNYHYGMEKITSFVKIKIYCVRVFITQNKVYKSTETFIRHET